MLKDSASALVVNSRRIPDAPESLSLSRRLFLGRFAASSVAATVGAVALAEAKPASIENPNLVQLGENLTRTEASYLAASEKLQMAYGMIEPVAVAIPLELMRTCEESIYLKAEFPILPDGRIIEIPGEGIRKIFTSASLNADSAVFSSRTKIGKFIRRKLPIARAYEAGVASARAQSGIDAAHKAHEAAIEALDRLAPKIMEQPHLTVAGLKIKAQAYSAIANLPNGRGLYSHVWGRGLAEAILQIDSATRFRGCSSSIR